MDALSSVSVELKAGGVYGRAGITGLNYAALLRAVIAYVDTPSLAASSILNFHGVQAQFLSVNLVSSVFMAFGLIVISQYSLRRDLENLASFDALPGVSFSIYWMNR